MKTVFEPTNRYYHRILDAKEEADRVQLYLDLLVEPWKPMMSMMQRPGTDQNDPLDGARAWSWLLPDQVETMRALLQELENSGVWEQGKQALEQSAACFEPYQDRIPFDSITGWLMLADPDRSNPFERGYTGAVDWMSPRFIGQFWKPNEYNLPRLPALIAHEIHHLIRLRLFPWGMNTNVADYIIIEGTAEAFAASLFGADKVGYFITEFSPDDFDAARQIIGKGLHETGFDVIRAYIFGDAIAERTGIRPIGGLPTYGGYSIGYHVVQAFLQRTDLSIEEATFLPAEEIVQGSRFFD